MSKNQTNQKYLGIANTLTAIAYKAFAAISSKETVVALTAAATWGAPADADASWVALKSAYNPDQEIQMLIIEGKHNFNDHLYIYGFQETELTNRSSTYIEGRLNQSAGALDDQLDKVGIAAEYNGGTGMNDFIRIGLTYVPDLGEDNFTVLKWYPIETDGNRGEQISLFTQQRLFSGLSASVLADYNVKPDMVYTELGLDFKVSDKVTFRIEGRGSKSIEEITKIRLNPYTMVTYEF